MGSNPSPNVIYLEPEDVIGFYADLFGLTDQEASDRLRDLGGLVSSLVRPRWAARYAGADIAQQAAVLAHGIAEGQYFLEGNKRTALVSLTTFLRLNGYRLTASQSERFQWIVDLSKPGDPEAKIADLAQRIQSRITPLVAP